MHRSPTTILLFRGWCHCFAIHNFIRFDGNIYIHSCNNSKWMATLHRSELKFSHHLHAPVCVCVCAQAPRSMHHHRAVRLLSTCDLRKQWIFGQYASMYVRTYAYKNYTPLDLFRRQKTDPFYIICMNMMIERCWSWLYILLAVIVSYNCAASKDAQPPCEMQMIISSFSMENENSDCGRLVVLFVRSSPSLQYLLSTSPLIYLWCLSDSFLAVASNIYSSYIAAMMWQVPSHIPFCRCRQKAATHPHWI